MNTTFNLTIEMGNDAMLRKRDVARAIDHVSTTIRNDATRKEGVIKDDNGNTVGRWEFVRTALLVTTASEDA